MNESRADTKWNKDFKKKVRTIAWYNEVAQRVGAENPNQTAKAFGNQYNGSWHAYAKGDVEPTKWLALVEAEYPGTRRIYEDGPEGIFVHLFSDGDLWDHPAMAQRGLTPDVLFADAVENFAGYLVVRQRQGELNLEDTCCAVRLYRLWASKTVPADSPAPYELLTYCCEQDNVIHALDRWGIRTNLLNYIKAAERERVSSNMSWQAMLDKIAATRHLPAESYVDDPIGFHARAQRKPRAAMTPQLIVADTYMAPKATKLLRLSRKELRILVVSLSGLLILATLSDIAVTHRLNAQEQVLHTQPHLKR